MRPELHPLPTARQLALRGLLWLVVAVVLTLPVVTNPMGLLLGDPRVDVWNHAWGYWFVADSLARGALPLHTELLGAPAGGALYFIDTPEAVVWTPVTWLLGPAAAYNGAMTVRLALTGLSGQLLAEALGAKRWGGWLSGAALVTLPFLLCEMANGISEVCTVYWVAFSLWAAARARARGSWSDWVVVGACLGLTTASTFYYGLTVGLLLAALFGGRLARLLVGQRLTEATTLALRGAVGAVVAALLAGPVWLGFRASLSAPDALIRRSDALNDALLRHNAVDPRVYVLPGDFQSVDLMAVYGEPFVHTAYLRWTLLALAALALGRLGRRLAPWVGLAALSLVLGLGSYLWWGDDWLMLGGRVLSLPFGWLLAVLPQVAITHPLRLSIGGQVLVAALAGVGLTELLAILRVRLSEGRGAPVATSFAGIAIGLVVIEGLSFSSASWPLPTSDAAIPAAYRELADTDGMVLDLPAEVGTTMLTSRYFWYQTAHGRPIPYTPDARLGSVGDREAFSVITRPAPGGVGEFPQVPRGGGLRQLAQRYSAIVVHPELEKQAGLSPTYSAVLTEALGPPEESDGVRVWRLDASSPDP